MEITTRPLAARFAPFIYFGGEFREGKERLRVGPAQRCCHGLWHAVDGRLTLRSERGVCELMPGDIAFVRPGCSVHLPAGAVSRYVAFDVFYRRRRRILRHGAGPAHFVHWWIAGPERPEPHLDALAAEPLPLVIEPARRDLAAQLMTDLLDTWWRRPGGGLLLANARLHQWLVWLLQGPTTGGTLAASADPVERAEHYARQRFTRGIRVTDLARSVGLSRSHFTRLYSQRREQTPAELLEDLQFAEAQRLLRDTNTAIRFVAKAAGLRNAQTLQRLFRARTRMTPRQWRLANRP